MKEDAMKLWNKLIPDAPKRYDNKSVFRQFDTPIGVIMIRVVSLLGGEYEKISKSKYRFRGEEYEFGEKTFVMITDNGDIDLTDCLIHYKDGSYKHVRGAEFENMAYTGKLRELIG